MAGFLKKLSSCQFFEECFGQTHGLQRSKCVGGCQALLQELKSKSGNV